MSDRLSGSNTQRFANLCSQVRERKKEAGKKNGYDLILVDDQKAGSSGSTSASGSRQAPLERANTSGSYNRLRTGRQVLVLTDDDASVSGDEDSISNNSTTQTAVDDLYSERGSARSRKSRYMNDVKRAIVERAADVGFIIGSEVRLPWKKLPELCAKNGVYIDNYPDRVDSPFEDEINFWNEGIRCLTVGEGDALLHALQSEKTYPMQFLSEKNPSDILNNRQPVIVYAPPPSDSPHERSKRIFLGRSYDYQGHPRIGSKTAKKRCLVNPLANKPEKRRQLFKEIQRSQPNVRIRRTLAPVHPRIPTTSNAETDSSVEISDDFLKTMEKRLFNYVFTYAERAMHSRDARR